ncbi:MAG: Ig-like domain-containing protein [Planctomycetia bacterium]|nr:Ig-like domain-containing protein [Planctomycetia bacterium]
MPHGSDDAPQVVAIDVQPKIRTMRERSQQRLLVTATLSDGSSRDVTHEAVYTSNDDTRATVDQHGRVATKMMAGESAIVARFQDHVAATFVTVPLNRAECHDIPYFCARVLAILAEPSRELPSARLLGRWGW